MRWQEGRRRRGLHFPPRESPVRRQWGTQWAPAWARAWPGTPPTQRLGRSSRPSWGPERRPQSLNGTPGGGGAWRQQRERPAGMLKREEGVSGKAAARDAHTTRGANHASASITPKRRQTGAARCRCARSPLMHLWEGRLRLGRKGHRGLVVVFRLHHGQAAPAAAAPIAPASTPFMQCFGANHHWPSVRAQAQHTAQGAWQVQQTSSAS
jgi:hypothetical protein